MIPTRRLSRIRPAAQSRAIRQLVEDAELGVGAALLAAVDVAHEPDDRRRLGGEPGRLARRGVGVAQLRGRVADGGEAGRRHVLRPADERVAKRPSLPRRAEDAADDPRARGVDRLHVCVGLGGRHLLRAEREPEDGLGRRRLAGEDGRRLDRVAGRRRRRAGGGYRPGGQGQQESEGQGQHGATHDGPPRDAGFSEQADPNAARGYGQALQVSSRPRVLTEKPVRPPSGPSSCQSSPTTYGSFGSPGTKATTTSSSTSGSAYDSCPAAS